MTGCCVRVLDPCEWLDNEDWEIEVALTQDATGLPVDLTGSRIQVILISALGRSLVAKCDSALGNGTLTITDPVAGKIRLVSRGRSRAWRCPTGGIGRISLPQTIEGDIVRFISNRVEGLGTIRFLVRPGVNDDDFTDPTEPGPDPSPPSSAFDHQQAAPASVWTIAHNLNARPGVSTFSVGGVEIEGEVQHLSADVLTVSFVKPIAGYAHIV